jgi:hypothetical protein
MAESNITMRLELSLTVLQMVEETQGWFSMSTTSGVPTLRITDRTDIIAWKQNFCSATPLMYRGLTSVEIASSFNPSSDLRIIDVTWLF